MILVFNPSAFKHDVTEKDIEAAMATSLFDELILGYDNKYLLIGFNTSGKLLEIMYNLVDEDIANIFHAMNCRNDVLRKITERGYYADFN
jgi:hypothetical protein